MSQEKKEKKTLSPKKRAVVIIANILLWALFGVLVFSTFSIFIQRISGKTPNLLGYRYYFILTGSMEPDLSPGDVVLSKIYDKNKNTPKIDIGDVVTYIIPEGEDMAGATITHKVIEAPYLDEATGKYYIVTKGTANIIKDKPIALENIQSVMVKRLPLLGKLYQAFLKNRLLLILLFLIPFLSLSSSIIYRQIVTHKKKIKDLQKEPVDDEEYKDKVIKEYLENKANENHKENKIEETDEIDTKDER